jgi:hypothetical protein
MSQIVQPDFFSQGGVVVGSSPYVLKNMGRFRHIALMSDGGVISKVEVFVNGTTYLDITGNTDIVSTTTAGLVLVNFACFQQYRITYTGTLYVTAN